MKKTIIMPSVILIVIACAAIAFTKSFEKHSTAISISFDKTDSLKAKIDTAQIFSILELDVNNWGGFQISVNTFSDFDFNPSSILELEAKSYLLSNPGNRKKEIAQFKKAFITLLSEVQRQAKELPKSSIYGPMIRDLNRLAKSKAERKIGVYYTDCRENTHLFSAYNKKDLALIKESPNEVKALLMRIEKPRDLRGIKVFLICQPLNDEENKCFITMSTFFKEILEQAGAKVFIGADLNVNEDL